MRAPFSTTSLPVLSGKTSWRMSTLTASNDRTSSNNLYAWACRTLSVVVSGKGSFRDVITSLFNIVDRWMLQVCGLDCGEVSRRVWSRLLQRNYFETQTGNKRVEPCNKTGDKIPSSALKIPVKTLYSSWQVELDLLRTLPGNRHFESLFAGKVPQLRRVLLAFAHHDPRIGYCQVH